MKDGKDISRLVGEALFLIMGISYVMLHLHRSYSFFVSLWHGGSPTF